MNKSKLEIRAHIISYIYSYIVLEKKLDSVEAFESSQYEQTEVQTIDEISQDFDDYKNIITSFLKQGWSWERINALEKAILIFGAYDLKRNDKALVINELVDITKGYIPGDKYKFINAVLEKIGDLYEKNN